MLRYKNILNVSKRTFNRRIRCSPYNSNLRANIDDINVSEVNPVPREVDDSQQRPTFDFLCESDIERNLSELDISDDEDISKSKIAEEFLKNWTFKNNINRNALSELLAILKTNVWPELPKDSRTLLQTPKARETITVDPGQYVHLGIKPSLDQILSKCREEIPNEILLDFNIDGVPLTRSNSSSFWLILARIYNLNKRHVFTIGVYFGYKKPKVFSDFLKPFVEELKALMITYKFEGRNIPIKIRAFILDAPARSATIGSKSHCGYGGYSKCN